MKYIINTFLQNSNFVDKSHSLSLFPLSAHQIEARHTFLETLLGHVKPEETESLETARTLVITITTCLCVFSLMEAVCYYIFSTAVNIHFFKIQIWVSINIIQIKKGASLEENNPGRKCCSHL